MGIPSFFAWLVDRYPLAVSNAVESTPTMVNGVPAPIDNREPNPNGVEFDNLYLDMNGIIHPCFHREGQPSPSNYEEVFSGIFKYIDRIFSVVRPRKLLFLAIDGVAPRAKMNQQRARRFKAAKERLEEREEENLTLPELSNEMDSNIITPGTEFMDLLSSALRYYIHLRMNEDLGWRGLKVILSDATVPGEGEHKIMSYIRLQRNLPGYDPNTRHCLYGLDADLIMLALASHEIHFTILREGKYNKFHNRVYLKKKKRKKSKFNDSVNLEQTENFTENLRNYISELNFLFLKIWVLREYLAYELTIPNSTFEADLERLIDDFIFICLFVGNDFLPHIPLLEISKGAIDLLMKVYKKEFVRMGGYLTDSFKINLTRVEHFIQAVGSHEWAIIKRPGQQDRGRHFQLFSRKSLLSLNPQRIILREKARFYAQKFKAITADEREKVRRNAVLKYTEGICWVMRYYFEGVSSWQWFYPYHYAPFASDFYGLDQFDIQFTLGEPFKPFDQLMGVLPAASAHALPLFYRKLITDSSSPILDFYPSDFEIDMKGKRFAWQGVCILPFIEESRLLSEIAKVEHTLTDEERRRNSLGLDVLFVHSSHPLANMVIPFSKQCGDSEALEVTINIKIDPKISDGMNGCIYISDKPVCPSEIYSPIDGLLLIRNNQVISILYKYPLFHSHIPRLLEGAVLPDKSVRIKDVSPPHKLLRHIAVSERMLSRREKMRTEIKSWKGRSYNKSFCNNISEKRNEDDVAPMNNVKNSENCVLVEQRGYGDLAGASGAEVSAKNRKRKWMEGESDNKAQLDNPSCVEQSIVNLQFNMNAKLGSCSNVNSFGAGTNVIAEIKTESISKKRKRKSKKKKIQSGNPGEQSKGAPVNADVNVVAEIRKEAKSKKRKRKSKKKKVQSGNPGQQSEDTPANAGANMVSEIKTEAKSKKKKRKSKKKNPGEQREDACVHTGANGIVEEKKMGREVNVELIFMKQGERTGDREGEQGLGLLETEIKPIDFQKLENSSLKASEPDLKPEVNPGGQKEYAHVHAGVNGIAEIKTDATSKKRKRKSKKKKVQSGNFGEQREDVHVHAGANGIVEKKKMGMEVILESVLIKQGEHICDHAGELGLGLMETEIKPTDFQKMENSSNKASEPDCKPVVNSKRKKRRSKKAKMAELDILMNNSEKLHSGLHEKQGECINDSLGVQNLGVTNAEIISNGFLTLDNSGMMASGLNLKPEVKSKRKKRRAKKAKVAEPDGVQTNNSEKLDPGVLRKLGGCNSDHVDAQTNNSEKLEHGVLRNQGEENNDHVGAQSKNGERLECVLREQGICNIDHVAVDGVGLMKTEVKSKKKRRLKMKLSETNSASNDNLETLETRVLGKSERDGDQLDVGGLECNKSSD